MVTSINDMVEVMAASARRTKKNVDHNADSDIWPNNWGIVMNNKPGPPATRSEIMVSGFAVSAKAEGKITTPARIATKVSRTET